MDRPRELDAGQTRERLREVEPLQLWPTIRPLAVNQHTPRPRVRVPALERLAPRVTPRQWVVRLKKVAERVRRAMPRVQERLLGRQDRHRKVGLLPFVPQVAHHLHLRQPARRPLAVGHLRGLDVLHQLRVARPQRVPPRLV